MVSLRRCDELRFRLLPTLPRARGAADGSIRELETHVILAVRLRYLNQPTADDLLQRAAEVGKIVTGLANSLKDDS